MNIFSRHAEPPNCSDETKSEVRTKIGDRVERLDSRLDKVTEAGEIRELRRMRLLLVTVAEEFSA